MLIQHYKVAYLVQVTENVLPGSRQTDQYVLAQHHCNVKYRESNFQIRYLLNF